MIQRNLKSLGNGRGTENRHRNLFQAENLLVVIDARTHTYTRAQTYSARAYVGGSVCDARVYGTGERTCHVTLLRQDDVSPSFCRIQMTLGPGTTLIVCLYGRFDPSTRVDGTACALPLAHGAFVRPENTFVGGEPCQRPKE